MADCTELKAQYDSYIASAGSAKARAASLKEKLPTVCDTFTNRYIERRDRRDRVTTRINRYLPTNSNISYSGTDCEVIKNELRAKASEYEADANALQAQVNMCNSTGYLDSLNDDTIDEYCSTLASEYPEEVRSDIKEICHETYDELKGGS